MRFRFILQTLVVWLGTAAVQAELLLELKNGDRLSGRVQGLRDGTVTLVTSYAGNLKVQGAHVVGLSSSQPLVVELQSGQRFQGPVSVAEKG